MDQRNPILGKMRYIRSVSDNPRVSPDRFSWLGRGTSNGLDGNTPLDMMVAVLTWNFEPLSWFRLVMIQTNDKSRGSCPAAHGWGWASSIKRRLQIWLDSGLDLLYPPHCSFCQEELFPRTSRRLCEPCDLRLAPALGRLCEMAYLLCRKNQTPLGSLFLKILLP